MTRRWIALVAAGVAAVASLGLTSISVYKTFAAEVLTVADLNSSFSRLLDSGVNPLIALHPGDSTQTINGVFDSLDAMTDAYNIGVKKSLVFRDQNDSLVLGGEAQIDTVIADTLRTRRAHVDTLEVDSLFAEEGRINLLLVNTATPVVGFNLATSAGTRATFGSLVDIDTLRFSGGGTTIDLPDTTISVNASGKKIIVGNLNDPAVMEDLAGFRADEVNTSYYRNGEGQFPTRYAITATTAGDSVVIWNRDNSTRWMLFIGDATAMLEDATPVVTGLAFRNMKLYISGTGGADATIIDFRRDLALQYSTGGVSKYQGTIYQRNGTQGWIVLRTSPAIVSNTVNAVSAIFDPFGRRDAAGQLEQWWAVGTGGGSSYFNPYTNAIYDNSQDGTEAGNAISLTSRGGVFYAQSVSTTRLFWGRSILSATGDGSITNELWVSTGSGSEDITWASDVLSDLAIVAGASASETSSDIAVIGSPSGLYVLHAKASDNTKGGKVRITASGQFPYEKGSAVLAFSGASSADGSPYNNVLTGVGAPGYKTATVSIPFSAAYSSTGTDSYLKREADSDFQDPRSYVVWFKTDDATNPAAAEYLIDLRDEVGATDDEFGIYLNTSGYLVGNVSDGTGTDTATGATDVADGAWHMGALVLRAASVDLFLDGELHAQDASLAITVGGVDTDTLSLGASHISGSYAGNFKGQFTYVPGSKDELSATEIRAVYNDGLKSIQSSVALDDGLADNASDIDYVDCIQEGWCAAGNEDSVMVFQVGGTTLIPYKRYGTPGGAIADVALLWEPGADSVSVFLVTPTRVQSVQPDPLVASAMAYRFPYVQPRVGETVVVDSSGTEGIFWHGDDAVDAAANADRGHVYFMDGTYPSFDADQTDQTIEGQSWNAIIDGTTVDDAIDVTVARVTVRGLSLRTTTGGGNAFDCVDIASGGTNCEIDHVKVISSDLRGVGSGAEDTYVHDCLFVAADNNQIEFNLARGRAIGNLVQGGSAYGIVLGGASADNGQIVDNHIQAVTNDELYLETGADNSIVNGNIYNGTITNNSTGSTVTDNESY